MSINRREALRGSGFAGLLAAVVVAGFSPDAIGQVVPPPPEQAPAAPVEEAPAPDRAERRRHASEAARDALPEAKKLLLDSAKALNQATSLRFTSRYRVEGNLPVKLGSVEARVTMLKPEGQKYHWITRAVGSGSLRDGEAPKPFDVAWYLDQTQVVDEGAKKVVVRKGRVTDASARAAEFARLKEMYGPTPWNTELEGATLALAPDEVVNGVNCRVVDVSYTANRRTARIWLGESDLIPRRFTQFAGLQNEQAQFRASMILELTDVEVGQPLAMSDVTVSAPDGFETESFVITERPKPEERARVGSRPGTTVGANSDSGDAPEGTVATQRPAPRNVLPAAPDFRMVTTDGSELTLSSMRGSVVVLDFWGTWALGCKQSGPELQGLHERMKDRGVRVIGIASKERNEEKAASTFKERGQAYTLVTQGGAVASAYGVATFPTVVVVGRAGEILLKVEKYVPGESIKQIEATIETHLASGG